MHHPVFEFSKWSKIFPLESFERRKGLRRFPSTPPDDPLDLWKATGEIITSPAHLCKVELVRQRVRAEHDLGRAVPVDIFIWRYGPPDKPYLTKIGGVPHREKSVPWPRGPDGKPYTFVAQFCFLDSKDIVSSKLPNDVMLVFFRHPDACFTDRGDVHIEWSAKSLRDPATKQSCPPPGFPVPELAGEIYRTNEYPNSVDVFRQLGHYRSYLLASTQSTKIGRETFVIQGDPRNEDQEFFCALSSIQPSGQWPFTNMERLPEIPLSERMSNEHFGWNDYEMILGDAGCMYFMIDRDGNVTWTADCY